MTDPHDIRLFAFDLDGTVLAPDKSVTPRTRAALRALMARGIEAVPTTGRSWQHLCEKVLHMDDFRYIVATCGQVVRDERTGEFLEHVSMPADVAAALIRRLLAPGVTIYVVLDDEAGTRMGTGVSADDYERVARSFPTYFGDTMTPGDVAAEVERRGSGVLKVGVRFTDGWDYADFHAIGREAGLTTTASDERNVEFNVEGASKAKGLELLAGRLGFGLGQVCAIGDSGNDADMLRRAGLGVAMGNASEEARDAADVVLGLTNAEEGLADFVERELLHSTGVRCAGASSSGQDPGF